jgi:hypothetical protein
LLVTYLPYCLACIISVKMTPAGLEPQWYIGQAVVLTSVGLEAQWYITQLPVDFIAIPLARC